MSAESERPPTRLVALVFDDEFKAEEAQAALHRLGGEGLLEIDELAQIVKGKDGKVRISQDVDTVAKDRRAGHLVGIVAAAVTGTLPLILAGTAGGALVGKLTDHGITNSFVKQVGEGLQGGTSALVILARSGPTRRAKVVERLKPFRPRIVESDLPPGLEQELQEMRKECPIALLRHDLETAELLNAGGFNAIVANARSRIKQAEALARSYPMLTPKTSAPLEDLTSVYA